MHVLRSVLLSLSQNGALRHWVETSPIADRITSRFVAGHSLEQEMRVLERLRGEGIQSSIDYLGENVTSLDEAKRCLETYLQALDRIAAAHLPSTVSIKLTQFGLDFSESACIANVDALVSRASDTGTRVEIDMESSAYTSRTLDIVSQMHAVHSSAVRAVIQAYLYRSADDVERMCAERVPVRLCKGAYNEPVSVAFAGRQQVDENYVRLMRTLLEKGTCPAIATHDERMIGEALRAVHELKRAPGEFEFQMLYGIRRDLQRSLVGKGYRLRLYVPYGDAWYPYFMRRMAERPANVLFVARNLLRA